MTWTYSQDPASSPKDRVRFEVQDITSTSPLLQDEEIQSMLVLEAGSDPTAYTEEGILGASAHCLEVLARRFAMQADTVIGSLSFTYSKMATNYAAQAVALRARAGSMAVPWAGGLSIAEKEANRDDCDLVQPLFVRREFSNPGSGSNDNGRGFDRGILP